MPHTLEDSIKEVANVRRKSSGKSDIIQAKLDDLKLAIEDFMESETKVSVEMVGGYIWIYIFFADGSVWSFYTSLT